MDLVALAVSAVALRVPAYLASIHLTFDDGVFGASAVAMRAGGRPFADVFSSQGPLFLPLVWLGDLLGLRTASSPRVLAVASGVALTLAAYGIGRQVTSRGGALLAAGLVSAGIGVLGVTGPLAADGPALALGAAGVLLALRWRDAPSPARALALGAVVGAALSIKALLVPAVLPVAVVLLRWRRPGLVVLAAGTSIALHLLAGLPWGWADVWDQAYAYHLDAAGDRTPLANLGKTASTLLDRDLPLVVLAVLAGGAAVRARTRLGLVDGLLLAWLAATLLVLVLEHPMWRPHVAHLVPPAAALVARHRPRWPVVAAALVLTAPYHVVHAWHLLDPPSYRHSTQVVVDALRALPEGALAISDDPGVVWRAGRRTTHDLVDASILRIETGRLDAAGIAREAARDEVCAVVVRSAVRWGSFEDLPDRLAAAGYEVARRDGHRVLYLKARCEP